MDVAVSPLRYAKSGDTHIAYQVAGTGPIDLVILLGHFIPIDALWDEPACAGFLTRLASFSRLILLDRRGVGSSDPVAPEDPPTLERWADDVVAVLDDIGSDKASVLAWQAGGQVAVLLAASQPDRIDKLVLFHAFARLKYAPDHAWGLSGDQQEAVNSALSAGEPALPLARVAPSSGNDAELAAWWSRATRRGASPATKLAVMEAVFGNDVRPLLRSINAPTLVLVRSEVDERIRRDARCLADGIPGSELTELAGADDLPWIGDASSVTDRISEFLTGVSRRVGVERIVATVLFTDIVGSTERAAALGDRRWSEMLSTHHAIVREQLRRFDGEEIDVAGDGFFARFTGPARAIECACAIRDAVQRVGLAIRAGVHTGEVELLGDDLRGIAVHIGARVGAHASANEVLVSRTVADLIAGSEIALEDRGEWDLRGVPGRWRLYAVAAVRDAGL